MKTEIKDIKPVQMGKMKHSLKVGSHNGGLDLMCRMYLDGELIREFKGHSFLMPFAYGLHALTHGGNANRFWGGIYDNDFTSRSTNIVGVSTGSPARINTQYSRFYQLQDDDYIWIWGVQGTASVVNGMKRVKRVDNNSADIYEMDGVTPVDTTGLSYDGGGYACLYGYRNSAVSQTDTHPQVLNSWDLIVGTDNSPVAIDDFGLGSRVQKGSGADQMSHTDTQISAQTTNKPSSRFTLSRSYTNNSGASIEINEIGIATRQLGHFNDSNELYTTSLIARDVLGSSVTVADTKTLTVQYEVITNLNPDTQDTETDGTNGGFVETFLNTMRVLATQSNYNYTDAKAFSSCSTPANTNQNTDDNYEGYRTGIRLGTDQTFTSMTDADLLSIINHGEADGELYHYGCNIEDDMVVDTANDKCVIEINRIFENRGSTDITIKEIGLYANRDLGGSNYSSDLIARTALQSTDWYTISPGEFVQVTYTIEVIA